MPKPDAKAAAVEEDAETLTQPEPQHGECPACGSSDTRQHDFRKKLCSACGHIGFNETFGGERIHSLDGAPQTPADQSPIPNADEPSAVEANARAGAGVALKCASAGKTEAPNLIMPEDEKSV